MPAVQRIGGERAGLTITMTNQLSVRLHRLTTQGDTGTAGSVRILDLRRDDGSNLPAFAAGAHVDLVISETVTRQYSLLNDPAERHRYVVAVALDAASRGGSRHVHDWLEEGDTLTIGEPRCHFPLIEDAAHTVFIAGGIGVTPLWAMAQRLITLGRPFSFYFGARNAAAAPLLAAIEVALATVHAPLHIVFADGDGMLDLSAIVAAAPRGSHFYACGPAGMLDAYLDATAALPAGQVHYERFAATTVAATEGGYEVELARTGGCYTVAAGQTILEALKLNGINVPHSCAEGICGACETRVIEGMPDHRDEVLSDAEKAANTTMMVCCSGSRSPRLVLDL